MVQSGGPGQNNTEYLYCASGYRTYKKTLDIGDWDMNTYDSKSVLHEIPDFKTIRGVAVVIKNDANDTVYPVSGYNKRPAPIWIESINALDIILKRASGSKFDKADFSATEFNRGYVTLSCIE